MNRTVCRDGSLRASEDGTSSPCAVKKNGTDGFEHWFTARVVIFQAKKPGANRWGGWQKVTCNSNQILEKVLCVLRNLSFFSIFTGEAFLP